MKVATRINDNNQVGTPISLGANFTGKAFGLESLQGYSVCASWTGATAAGTLKLQASNNPFLNNVNLNEDPNAVWVDITGSSFTVSGPGTYFWNVADAYYQAVRVVFTQSSGTGSMSLFINGKGIQ